MSIFTRQFAAICLIPLGACGFAVGPNGEIVADPNYNPLSSAEELKFYNESGAFTYLGENKLLPGDIKADAGFEDRIATFVETWNRVYDIRDATLSVALPDTGTLTYSGTAFFGDWNVPDGYESDALLVNFDAFAATMTAIATLDSKTISGTIDGFSDYKGNSVQGSISIEDSTISEGVFVVANGDIAGVLNGTPLSSGNYNLTITGEDGTALTGGFTFVVGTDAFVGNFGAHSALYAN